MPYPLSIRNSLEICAVDNMEDSKKCDGKERRLAMTCVILYGSPYLKYYQKAKL